MVTLMDKPTVSGANESVEKLVAICSIIDEET